MIGGLSSLQNGDAAKDFVSNKLWELYGPQPEIYIKGEFRGIVFAKFDTNGERDAAVRILRATRCNEGGNVVWAKPDKPADVRVLQSLVFGTKHALGKYYDKRQIWGDTNEEDKSGELWLGSDKVFTASVNDHNLAIAFDEGWEKWIMHGDYPEFQNIIETVKSKLASAKGGGKSKGKTKGGGEDGKSKGSAGDSQGGDGGRR